MQQAVTKRLHIDPDSIWTIDRVEQRLKAAGRALRRLPGNDVARLSRVTGAWPEMAEQGEDWMARVGRMTGDRRGDNVTRMPATIEDMNALDQVIKWHGLVRPGDRHRVRGGRMITLPPAVWQIILSRAVGASWRQIIRHRYRSEGGTSHVSCQRIYRAALALLTTRLN